MVLDLYQMVMRPIPHGATCFPAGTISPWGPPTTNSFLGPTLRAAYSLFHNPPPDGGRACGLRRFGHFVLISNFLFLWAEAEPIYMPI